MSSMTFVELLFWKNTRDAEEVREEYGWQVPVLGICVTVAADGVASNRVYT